MITKIKLTKDQRTLIKGLSKEVNMPENEIASFLVEMGISYIIIWRKGKITESLEKVNKKVSESEFLTRICQRIEHFFDEGE